MKEVVFQGFTCRIVKDRYEHDGSIALSLVDKTDGQPVATATVCLPDLPLREGHVAIKNYSENQGILEVLQKANVISDVIVTVPLNPFANVHICECLV